MLQTRKQPTRLTHKFIISAGPAEAHAMNLLRLQKLPKPVQSFKLSSKILNCNLETLFLQPAPAKESALNI